MKEKIKKIGIGIGILIIVLIAAGLWIDRQAEIKNCKRLCLYIPPSEPTRGRLDKGDYWQYFGKKFATQEQCIDYCLTIE